VGTTENPLNLIMIQISQHLLVFLVVQHSARQILNVLVLLIVAKSAIFTQSLLPETSRQIRPAHIYSMI
jgi:hypothetical protein